MERLTKKQERTYNAIKEYIGKYGFSPTIRELCEMTGVKSTATVYCSLKVLKRKGYIAYLYNRNRTIRLLNED